MVSNQQEWLLLVWTSILDERHPCYPYTIHRHQTTNMNIAGRNIPQELVDCFVSDTCHDDLSTSLHCALVCRGFRLPAQRIALQEVFVDVHPSQCVMPSQGLRVWHCAVSAISFFSGQTQCHLWDIPQKLTICSNEEEDPDFVTIIQEVMSLLLKVHTVRFRYSHITALASSTGLFSSEVRSLYCHDCFMTPKTMLGLLHAFLYTRKLALVGSYMDVNRGGDMFRVNKSGENVDYAISTSETHEMVQQFKVLVLHFYALPDEDVVTLSRWLSRASELEGLYVKVTNDTDILAAQKLVSSCASTLRKLNVHIYGKRAFHVRYRNETDESFGTEGGIWMVPIDLKACQCLQSLNICCTDYYGHMLVDILESVRPVTGADTLQIQLSIHT